MVSGFHPDDARDDGAAGALGAADPVADDRHAAHTLARDLERGDLPAKPWGALSSAVVAFLSLGAMPVLLWHDRFREFVDDERRQLRRFAEWLRLHSTRPETMDLRVAADDLGTRPLLSSLSMLSVLGLFVLFASQLNGENAIVQQVLAHTYDFRTSRGWDFPLSDRQRLFAAWSVGLSVAYLFHWVQVQAHASDVRRFVGHANRVFRAAGVRRVPKPRVGLGVAFLWAVAAAALASKGAWWGIALALSGVVQQRYMGTQSLRLRRALAARVRELARLPLAHDERVGRTGTTSRRCPHVRCLAPMRADARFCPRCGHNVAKEGGGRTA